VKLIADLSKGELKGYSEGGFMAISNIVRTLRDHTRARDEIVRSMPDDLPYDPQRFPKGTWNITAVEWQKDAKFSYDLYGPVKIRTDATQWVNAWKLDKDGDYLEETDRRVEDHGYLLHWTKSSTTWGCIKIESPEAAEALGAVIEKALKNGEPVQLEVI
jgi:hypothetical protein